ncbi:glycoside hydrolase family 28 protein [Aspergillus mulundensis]|uniref:endo-polygalacturonase n=1 Tax=Aspergillus mulundensis TaxID=1810919 RepID=A0A3D8SBV9_9EURO|nr:putative endopolygalacturonase D [Aspergillus mulundensis]RDW83815.1 putative endopolygalacturonase D [Aspergillus mulundensis]
MKRCALLTPLGLLPLALACNNPNDAAHSCASVYSVSSVAAASFCATFTASTVTETTGVPDAFLSACDSKVKHLSSACSCLGPVDTATAPAATSTAPAAVPVTATATATATAVATPSQIAVSVPSAASSSSIATFKTEVISASSSSSSASAPATTSAPTKASATTTYGGNGGTTCTVTEYSDISSAVASCTNILLSDIYAPPSSTIDLQDLQTGAAVIFAGKTTFGTTADSDFDPIVISGTDLTITGTDDHVIDGNGQAYWDGQGSNGGSDKPDHFIVLKHVYDSVVANLNIQNWPVHCFDIENTESLTLTGITLDNSAGDEPNDSSDGDAAAHNSDGFDIKSSTDLVLSNSNVYNQDDCVAITSGTNITVDGMYCSGGHGLSIGSIGGKSDNTVDGVVFSNSQVVDSQNGCRIKTNEGETGEVANIKYENISLSGITKYGIVIQQDYLNGGPTGEPSNGVSITNVEITDVTGTMSSDDGKDYYILCGDGSCENFTFSGVSITGGSGDSCNYPDSGCP